MSAGRRSLSPSAFRARLLAIAALGVASVAVVLGLAPIPQDPRYHDFADKRVFLGIPNFLNVASNLPFLFVGISGLLFLRSKESRRPSASFIETRERWPFFLLFAAVAAVAFGSSYYHLMPDNDTLFWDRLPMTIVFMSLLSTMIAERIDLPAGLTLLLPFNVAGVTSMVYWRLSELRGAGDLRYYGVVQYYPMVAIPLLLLLFPPRYSRTGDLVVTFVLYAVAKIFELFDAPIFSLGRVASGHTLKHIGAAGATWCILRWVKKRTPGYSPNASSRIFFPSS